MGQLIFALFISIGLPLLALIYAFYRKRPRAFLLGVLAFVVSQLVLRLPLLEYVSKNSTSFAMLRVTEPILYVLVLALSAGVFEELSRYVMMRFFLQQRDWLSGFLFGAGHGGIEAVLFVGISAFTLLFSQALIPEHASFFAGGVERFFAMILHIGLSLIVLRSVVEKKFLFVIIAIAIHTFVNAMAGLLPVFVPETYRLIVLEGALAVMALAVFSYSLLLKKKGVLQ